MKTAQIEIPGYTTGTWTIDPVHSYVGFAIRHLMVSNVHGQFESVSDHVEVTLEIEANLNTSLPVAEATSQTPAAE